MTKKLEIYKCAVCSNVVEIVSEGVGTLVCCGENMSQPIEHEAPKENAHYAHLETIDETTKKITFNHVATVEHHIEFIEIISNDNKFIKRKFLEQTPDGWEKPEIIFKCNCKDGFRIRLYCNIDGVWVTR